MRNLIRTISILIIFISLQACTAVALTGLGLAAGVGVDHTLTGVVYKTFTIPSDKLQAATVKSLKRMDIKVIDKEKTDKGWVINAKAMNRKIEIQLEALTPNTTRMRVVAHKDKFFFKDGATATEIVVQTAKTLNRAYS